MPTSSFQGERLTLARKRRGLNKTAVARIAGVTPQMITAYERSRSTPSDQVIESLADGLSFPRDFFFTEPIDEVPLDSASFRSLSRMTKAQEHAALASGQLCIELANWIDERFSLPVCAVPDLDPGIIDPEGAAAYVRTQWGLGDAPISNVLQLMEAHGVRVFALAAECREVDAFSFWREETGTPFICLGTHKTPERAVFDLAHELGHLILHRDHGAPRGRHEERDADAFASNFLMPAAEIYALAPRSPTFDDLVTAKKRWRVSAAALNYRMHHLGLLSEWHYRSLCIEIARLGRDQEVDSIPREQSQILTKVLAALRDEGVTRAAIAADLHMYQPDLNDLIGGLVVSVLQGGGQSASDPGQRPHLRLA